MTTTATQSPDPEDHAIIEALQRAPRKDPVQYDAALTAEAKKLVDEMIESVTTTALNQDRDAGPAMGRFEDRMTGNAPVTHEDVFAAFLAGIHAGSVAVGRQWVKKNPESMWAYYALGGQSPDAADLRRKGAA